MPFTTTNFNEMQDDVKILKVEVPQNYTEKEMKNINKLVKEQVGDIFHFFFSIVLWNFYF